MKAVQRTSSPQRFQIHRLLSEFTFRPFEIHSQTFKIHTADLKIHPHPLKILLPGGSCVERLGIDLEMPGLDLERPESGSCKGGNITKKLKVKWMSMATVFLMRQVSAASPHSHLRRAHTSTFPFLPILAFSFGATGCLCLWRHVAHPFPI